IWPVESLEQIDGKIHAKFVERIQAYMEKALREAKVHTSWISPNLGYEGAVHTFVDGLLRNTGTDAFLRDALPFIRKVSAFGMYNSLSQTLLKLTSPGVPDIYQGTELWDLSLVDP